MRRRYATESATAVVALTLAVAGCNGPLLEAIPGLWEKQVKVSYPTAPQRIEALQQLADEADRQSPEEQNRTTIELARQIRDENDPVIREQMLRTIAKFRTPTATAILKAGLTDENPDVRIIAIDALAEQGAPDTARALGEVLRTDTDDDVRMAAARALEKFTGPDAISALAVALEDRNPALQHRAVVSLREATGRDLGGSVESWREFIASGNAQPAEAPSVAERLRKLRPF